MLKCVFPLSIAEGFEIGFQSIFSDAGKCHSPAFCFGDINRMERTEYFGAFRKDERMDSVVNNAGSLRLFDMPLSKKRLAMFTRTPGGDEVWASLIESRSLHTKTAGR